MFEFVGGSYNNAIAVAYNPFTKKVTVASTKSVGGRIGIGNSFSIGMSASFLSGITDVNQLGGWGYAGGVSSNIINIEWNVTADENFIPSGGVGLTSDVGFLPGVTIGQSAYGELNYTWVFDRIEFKSLDEYIEKYLDKSIHDDLQNLIMHQVLNNEPKFMKIGTPQR